LLRPGLLAGVSLLIVGSAEHRREPAAPAGELLWASVREACESLGARVRSHEREAVAPNPAAGEAEIDAAVARAASELGGLDMLVVDGAAMFASEGLRGCLEGAWSATRAVVNLVFLPAGPSPSTRRILYLAPPPAAQERAGAARAGLENLARTLSTEWARYGITVVTIAPGDGTSTGEVAALCAYLASPAGDYFSGCLLDLRGP
jgi:NAD(P)-dependent dehydrogenase (short-subunit alcohol dehydrogenase family)